MDRSLWSVGIYVSNLSSSAIQKTNLYFLGKIYLGIFVLSLKFWFGENFCSHTEQKIKICKFVWRNIDTLLIMPFFISYFLTLNSERRTVACNCKYLTSKCQRPSYCTQHMNKINPIFYSSPMGHWHQIFFVIGLLLIAFCF